MVLTYLLVTKEKTGVHKRQSLVVLVASEGLAVSSYDHAQQHVQSAAAADMGQASAVLLLDAVVLQRQKGVRCSAIASLYSSN